MAVRSSCTGEEEQMGAVLRAQPSAHPTPGAFESCRFPTLVPAQLEQQER